MTIITFRHCMSILLFGVLLAASPVQAREVVLCTMNWEPFYGEEMPREGFFTELVRTAFERAGHTVKVEFMPWPRAVLEVEQGDRDVLLGAYWSEERAETFHASETIYEDETGLVAKESLGIERFESLRELTDYTIGVGRGFVTSEEFDEADYLDKDFEETDVHNLRKLDADRIDMIAGSFVSLRHFAEKEDMDVSSLVSLEPALAEHSLHIMISRAVPDGEELLDDFHSGLETIREDGTYTRILEEMGFADPGD